MNLHVVVLAAGKGTRMKSARPTVLHLVAGRSVIDHVLNAVDRLNATGTILVVGSGGDAVRAALAGRPGLQFAAVTQQLGTGYTLLQAESLLPARSGTVLVLRANVPLVEAGTLLRLVEHHRSKGAALTLLTAEGDEPSGLYCFDLAPLFAALRALAADAAHDEFYLEDLIPLYRQQKRKIETLSLESADELRSVTTRIDVADLTAILRARKNRELMLAGVTLEDPATTYVDVDVTVGADTTIGPGVELQGRTSVGERCRIHAGARLTNATIGDQVTILDRTVIVDSRVANGAQIGPFAHIRPDSDIAEDARVGNFVELKKTSLGRRSKANHLAYLGDATIGEDVNVGAGTITCNYDGVKKHKTIIEDGVFIGSDSQLIAPVRIGKGAYVGAGSSITKDVPEDALAVARGRQETKPGWAATRRARSRSEKR
jgi:bifunctional UDP-N-acetylglucosamine pyrophosphorylase/glucosamine-1-phosphate N-acetyltransferase